MDGSKREIRTAEEVPAGLIPLREPTLYILLTLSRESKHGYAILKDVEALSEGRIVLSIGTLYGALARLLAQGVIRKTAGERESPGTNGSSDHTDTRTRKVYELTEFGHRVLSAEIERLRSILTTARQALGEEGI